MYHLLALHQHISITRLLTPFPTILTNTCTFPQNISVCSPEAVKWFQGQWEHPPVCVRGQQRVDWIVIALYLARTLNISLENYPSAEVIWNQSLTTFRSAKVLGVLTLRGVIIMNPVHLSPITNEHTHRHTHLCTHLLSLAFQLNPITVFLRDKPWWNLSINEIYASSFKLVIASRLHSFY